MRTNDRSLRGGAIHSIGGSGMLSRRRARETQTPNVPVVHDTVLDHIDFGTSDYAASRDFYSRALAPLDIRLLMEIRRRDGSAGAGFGRGREPQFWIGEGHGVAGRLHFAFAAKTRQAVDEFYAAAMAAGATSKGEPGLRPRYGDHYYAAFVYDPDGHTVEAVCRAPE